MPILRLALFLIFATVLGCHNATSPTVGAAKIMVAVSGLDTDPDGFEVMVDGESATRLAGAGSVTLDLSVGQHIIALGGLASNCAMQVPAVQTITVRESDTAQISFAVVCAALTGVVHITVVTTGVDPGANAYQITLDDGPVYGLAPNGAISVPRVAGGTHTLRVDGLATNCSVAGPNPMNVGVSVGGLVRHTVDVTVNVTCTALTGVVQVTATTTGPGTDPDGYTVSLDGGPVRAVVTNGAVWISGVSGGTHSLSLSGLAPNCSVTGSNPVIASVEVGGLSRDTARVAFSLTCAPNPPTGADLVLTTTGANPDNLYNVAVFSNSCGFYYYYCSPVWEGNVPGNGTVPLVLPVDSYTYIVSDIAPNCSGPTSGSFNVTNQQVTRVALAYTCVPTGTVVVDVQASGVDVGPFYSIFVDGAIGPGVAAGGRVSIVLPPGTHSIGLSNVNSNCTVATTNPVSAIITAGATTNVSFSVICVANPVLRVTVTTTGPGGPASYLVGVDYDSYYGFLYSATIPSNGTVSLSLPSGAHIVSLYQVPLNCTVTSPNNVAMSIPPGSTTDLAFAVLCH